MSDDVSILLTPEECVSVFRVTQHMRWIAFDNIPDALCKAMRSAVDQLEKEERQPLLSEIQADDILKLMEGPGKCPTM